MHLRREVLAVFGDHPVLFIHLDLTKLVLVEAFCWQVEVRRDSMLKYFRSAKIVIQPAHGLGDRGGDGGGHGREIELVYQGKLAIAVSDTGLVYSDGDSLKLVDLKR